MISRARLAAAMAALTLLAGASKAAGPAALGGVRPGLWTFSGDGGGAMPRRMCIADAAALIQMRHPGSACSRMVLADGGGEATVHYSCPGAGWGRTSLHVVTASAVRIDTQGIADNAPFAWRAEARRAGDCRR